MTEEKNVFSRVHNDRGASAIVVSLRSAKHYHMKSASGRSVQISMCIAPDVHLTVCENFPLRMYLGGQLAECFRVGLGSKSGQDRRFPCGL